ncbi:MAG TPA: adenylate kinase family protein [Acidobacteriota bacterium]|nr:adenylate kinase family protein [Acidobacteriota bacterium]
MILAISGTPGTGKSTLASQLAQRSGWELLDGTAFIKKNKIFDSYDRTHKSYIVDTALFARKVVAFSKKHPYVIVDSHLSHYIPKKYVEAVIVTNCELKALSRRLTARGYSKQKVRENLDAEIFDVCATEALEAGHTVIKIDCTKKLNKRKIEEIFKKLQSSS